MPFALLHEHPRHLRLPLDPSSPHPVCLTLLALLEGGYGTYGICSHPGPFRVVRIRGCCLIPISSPGAIGLVPSPYPLHPILFLFRPPPSSTFSSEIPLTSHLSTQPNHRIIHNYERVDVTR